MRQTNLIPLFVIQSRKHCFYKPKVSEEPDLQHGMPVFKKYASLLTLWFSPANVKNQPMTSGREPVELLVKLRTS